MVGSPLVIKRRMPPGLEAGVVVAVGTGVVFVAVGEPVVADGPAVAEGLVVVGGAVVGDVADVAEVVVCAV